MEIVVLIIKAISKMINRIPIHVLVDKYLIKSSPKYYNKVSFILYLYIIKPIIPNEEYIHELINVPKTVDLSIFLVFLGWRGKYIGNTLIWNTYAFKKLPKHLNFWGKVPFGLNISNSNGCISPLIYLKINKTVNEKNKNRIEKIPKKVNLDIPDISFCSIVGKINIAKNTESTSGCRK